MNRPESALHIAAEIHWRGSGARIVSIYRACTAGAGRGAGIGAAMLCSIALTSPARTRREALEALGERIPPSTRGAARTRAQKARDALTSLLAECTAISHEPLE